jgi:hypothetical protein
MSSTGDFILGGLLSGAGQAITKNADQARIDALEALKRQYQVEDRNYAADQEMQRTDAEIQGRKEIVGMTVEGNIATQREKTAGDAYLAKLKGTIDLNNTKTIEALKHTYSIGEDQVKAALDLQNQLALAGQTVDHWAVTTDNRLVAFNKQGGVLRYSAHPGSFPTGGGSSDNQSVSDLLDDTPPSGAKAKGSPPAKAPTANTGKGMPPGWDGQKELQFERLYTQATPQNAPRLFRDGHKIPADEARLMIAGAL